MNRKSPSLYVRIKMNYFRLILKGIKILESRENKSKFYFNKQLNFINSSTNTNSKSKSYNTFAYKILFNPFQKEIKTQIYNKYKLWLVAIGFSYVFFYLKHNYTQPVSNNNLYLQTFPVGNLKNRNSKRERNRISLFRNQCIK